jgi:hypothetical protein
MNKNLKKSLSGILLIVSFLITISCDKNEPEITNSSKLQFVFSDQTIKTGRTKSSASSLLITVKDSQGKIVEGRKKLDLFEFGDEYLSEPISLTPGNYTLIEFLILDENDDAIYATPIEGSELAYLVSDPLPIDFVTTKDEITKIVPQVISTDESNAEDFGYATFSFGVVKTFNFYAAVFAYDNALQNFALTNANISITASTHPLYSKDLDASTHNIRIEDGFSEYVITVVKEGYRTYSKSFTINQIKQYIENEALTIVLFDNDVEITSGLVANYPFNGNANDVSGNNLNGTVNGATLSTDRFGNSSAAYSFDGNDYIIVNDNDLLDFQSDTDFAISLWALVSPTQNPNGTINDILRKWSGDAQGYPFSISFVNQNAAAFAQNKFLVVRYDGSNCGNAPSGYSPAINRSEFYHIVMSKEGSTIRQYVNNILVSETTDNTSCTTSNNSPMTIGSRGQLVTFFTGKIDDIKIYNKALSEEQVSMLYFE